MIPLLSCLKAWSTLHFPSKLPSLYLRIGYTNRWSNSYYCSHWYYFSRCSFPPLALNSICVLTPRLLFPAQVSLHLRDRCPGFSMVSWPELLSYMSLNASVGYQTESSQGTSVLVVFRVPSWSPALPSIHLPLLEPWTYPSYYLLPNSWNLPMSCFICFLILLSAGLHFHCDNIIHL